MKVGDRKQAERLKKSSSGKTSILIPIVLVLFFASALFAQTTYTSNVGSGVFVWNNSANWLPATAFPVDGDTAVIAVGDTISVTADVQIDSLNVLGVLQFTANGGTAVTFTLDGNATVSGEIVSIADGSGTAIHAFDVAGDLTGSGNFDGWEVNGLPDYSVIDIDFNGSSEQIFSIDGNILEFYNFAISNNNTSGNSLTTLGSSNYNVYAQYLLGASAGTVSLGNRTIVMDGGNFIINSSSGVLSADNSIIKFIGGSNRKIQIDNDQNFASIDVAKTSGTFTLEGDGTAGDETFTIEDTLFLADVAVSLLGADIGYGSPLSATSTVRYAGTTDVGSEWTSTLAPANIIVNTSLNLGNTNLDSLEGNLNLASGSMDYSGTNNSLSVSGNVIGGSGTFGASDDTLVILGSTSKITSSNSASISNLRISPIVQPTDLRLQNDIEIEGILDLDMSNSLWEIELGNGGISLANGASIIVSSGILNLNGNSITKDVPNSNPLTISTNGSISTGGSSLTGFSSYTLNGTVVYSGSVLESMPGLSFTNLTIDNSSNDGVSVSNGTSPSVSGVLSFVDGILNTESGTFTITSSDENISSGNYNSYIEGPVNIVTASTDTVVLPLGDNGYWRPIGLAPSSSSSNTFNVESISANPQTDKGDRSAPGTGVSVISQISYWTVSRTAGSDSAYIDLNWRYSTDGVGNPSTLLVLRWTGSDWSHRGGNAGAGSTTTVGNVTSTSRFQSFGDFTLGSSQDDNSLPVELSSFAAKVSFKEVVLSWKTYSELENDGFYLYRRDSEQTNDWIQVNQAIIQGQGNTSQMTEYEYIDRTAAAGQKYEYMLESVSYNGVRVQEKTIEVDVPVPTDYSLLGNFPNPFNPTTEIRFQLPEKSEVTIKIYDIRGNLVDEPALKNSFDAGEHSVTWEAISSSGNNVASGMYIYLFQAGRFQKTGKMILLK